MLRLQALSALPAHHSQLLDHCLRLAQLQVLHRRGRRRQSELQVTTRYAVLTRLGLLAAIVLNKRKGMTGKGVVLVVCRAC